jgi:hypothetical protein
MRTAKSFSRKNALRRAAVEETAEAAGTAAEEERDAIAADPRTIAEARTTPVTSLRKEIPNPSQRSDILI